MSTPPSAPVSPSRGSPPPADLRHMTSNSGLVSTIKEPSPTGSRASQLFQAATSRSASSIPSSPTSVHSSSSAIFERDIEPLASPSPPQTALHPPNPHRIPRAKTTEQLEQSVPSVLDSAAAILASLPDDNGDLVAVEAPASFDRSSGFASPIDSYRSRSPSPIGNRGGNRNSLLLNIPHPNQVISGPHVSTPIPQSGSPTSPSPPNSGGMTARPNLNALDIADSGTPPSIITPTSAYFSTASSAESSPTTTTREHPAQLPGSPPASMSPQLSPSVHSHPPSPVHVATKRLSFMSYNDLLASTPASTHSLSSLTSSASTVEPPPHIPSVNGLTQAPVGGSSAGSLRGLSLAGNRDSILLLDDAGGEWERSGMGMGLEERLEALLPVVGGRA
ncbi:hypothetical protein C8J56DRAFT_909022 [Mycena floridula]|nr:hypothetical protein C8J56DRAFT_909022 [Mycena floridula]